MSDELDFYSPTSIKSYNLNDTMRYQLSMLDTLDAFTRRHSEGVANLTCRLCEQLRLNSNFTVYCTTCAYLHDVGKIFIPPEILQKKSKLTAEEYEIMKTHAIKGYKMCYEDEKLRPFANGALYHHEALDGSGYPNHKTMEAIPLEGQIIRVADEYDAIVNKRQYKSHIGISDTLKILIGNATPRPIPKKMQHNYDKDYVKLRKHFGKINKNILSALFKVVISDVEYEITSIDGYVKFLQEQTERLQTIHTLNQEMNSATKMKKKNDYMNKITQLLDPKENLGNYFGILTEYEKAHTIRKQKIDNLYNEINVIKHLKI